MRRILTAALASLALVPAAARAGQDSATFQVTATVTKTCTITAPSAVQFGAMGPNDPAKTVTAALTVACTKGASYDMTLSSQNAWAMKDASGNAIPYAIFQPDPATGNAAQTTSWTSGNTYTYTSLSRANKDLMISVVVTPADVPAGDYSDKVTATIAF
jgi:spore coat protein U-like protein